MKLYLNIFILHIIIATCDLYSSNQESTSDIRIFNSLPFITEIHTFLSSHSELQVVFHLTTTNNITKRALLAHLFSEERKQKFQMNYRVKNLSTSERELEQAFQAIQIKALEKIMTSRYFSSMESSLKKCSYFNFTDKETVNISLILTDKNNPYIHTIKLFNDYEFFPKPPTKVFDYQNQTMKYTFNIRHKKAEKAKVHDASWLYMNLLNKSNDQ